MATFRCQICGKMLKGITNTHLKSHGLTMAEYKRLFNVDRLRNYDYKPKEFKCKLCGKTFKAIFTRKGLCHACYREYRLAYDRKMHELYRMSKNLKVVGSTTDKKISEFISGKIPLNDMLYLTYNGYGNSYTHYDKDILEQLLFLDLLKRACAKNGYCEECGGLIIIAKENRYYSKTELTCKSCGLVFDISNLN